MVRLQLYRRAHSALNIIKKVINNFNRYSKSTKISIKLIFLKKLK